MPTTTVPQTARASNVTKSVVKPELGANRNKKSNPGPTDAEVRQRAFEIYQARGCQPGRDAEDWAQAQAELARARQKNRAS